MNEKILEAKKAVVDEVNQTLVGSKCAVVISYQGLKVSELNVLRKGLKSVGATMQVHKNTLMKRAIDADGFNALDSLLKGPNALITAADPTAALPILNKFAKKNKALVIKGAIIDGTFCDTAKIQTLVHSVQKKMLLLCFFQFSKLQYKDSLLQLRLLQKPDNNQLIIGGYIKWLS